KAKRPEDYDTVLSAELDRVYELMEEISPDKRVTDLLLLKYDYHNLKVMVKEYILESDFSDMYVNRGTVDFQKLKADYLANNFKKIQIDLRTAFDEVISYYAETDETQSIDLILNKYYFNHLYKLAEEKEIDLFIEYVSDLIDFTNIRALIRLKKQNKTNR